MLNKMDKAIGAASAEADEGDGDEAMDLGGASKADAVKRLASALGVTVKDEAAAVSALTDFVASCAPEDYE